MTPDNSLSLAEKHGLAFPVLSDRGLKVAGEFGLVYTLPLELRGFFREGGIDLTMYNGDGSWKLPMPATYVTDHDGIVVSRVSPDWRERLDPLEIIARPPEAEVEGARLPRPTAPRRRPRGPTTGPWLRP